ncbi:hypothetical protein D3C81_1227180 [compost metagenome]
MSTYVSQSLFKIVEVTGRRLIGGFGMRRYSKIKKQRQYRNRRRNHIDEEDRFDCRYGKERGADDRGHKHNYRLDASVDPVHLGQPVSRYDLRQNRPNCRCLHARTKRPDCSDREQQPCLFVAHQEQDCHHQRGHCNHAIRQHDQHLPVVAICPDARHRR